jgi:hypothetical protein
VYVIVDVDEFPFDDADIAIRTYLSLFILGKVIIGGLILTLI